MRMEGRTGWVTTSAAITPSEACLAAAIAIEEMQHLIRRKLCGVTGFQLSQLLSAWIGPKRSELHGRVIQALQTTLRTITLHDPHSFLAQTRA
jgi:hypothetical protein